MIGSICKLNRNCLNPNNEEYTIYPSFNIFSHSPNLKEENFLEFRTNECGNKKCIKKADKLNRREYSRHLRENKKVLTWISNETGEQKEVVFNIYEY